jgi:hypothetical protein
VEDINLLVEKIISEALIEARRRDVAIYTFALYYDHESPAVSVCIDTEERSKSSVIAMNKFVRGHFSAAVADGDLERAESWHGNIGRSLSLGDFHMVNVARTELPRNFAPNSSFFLTIIRSLMSAESAVAAQARLPSSLLFCCSGAKDEVQYWWSVAS